MTKYAPTSKIANEESSKSPPSMTFPRPKALPDDVRDAVAELERRFAGRKFFYGVGHYPPFSFRDRKRGPEGPLCQIIDMIASEWFGAKPERRELKSWTGFAETILRRDLMTIATPIYPLQSMPLTLIPFALVQTGFIVAQLTKARRTNLERLTEAAGRIEACTHTLARTPSIQFEKRNAAFFQRRQAIDDLFTLLGSPEVTVTKEFLEGYLFRAVFRDPDKVAGDPDPFVVAKRLLLGQKRGSKTRAVVIDGPSLARLRSECDDAQFRAEFWQWPLLGNPVHMPGGFVFHRGPESESLLCAFAYALRIPALLQFLMREADDMESGFSLIPPAGIHVCVQAQDNAMPDWDYFAQVNAEHDLRELVCRVPADQRTAWMGGRLIAQPPSIGEPARAALSRSVAQDSITEYELLDRPRRRAKASPADAAEAMESWVQTLRNAWRVAENAPRETQIALAVLHGLVERVRHRTSGSASVFKFIKMHFEEIASQRGDALRIERDALALGLPVCDPEEPPLQVRAFFGYVEGIEGERARIVFLDEPQEGVMDDRYLPTNWIPLSYRRRDVSVAWVERSYSSGVKGRLEPGGATEYG